MSEPHVIGVDVGTGSVRAGIFDLAGRLKATAKHGIDTFYGPDDIVEQSAEDIWRAVCTAVRAALVQAALPPGCIEGIGFDATCSLVVVGDTPLPVGDDPARDVIVWMDHRALDQARRINATRHPVLAYVGGTISPEMQTPKLLWLKEHRPETFAAARHFFDLTDYLTWRSTGGLERSVCTVTCKWTYLAHEGRWDDSYFRQIGLPELADEGFRRIGETIVEAGTPVAAGLTPAAADALGLQSGTQVAAGLIDAHAGGIGSVGHEPSTHMAYVFGTSACTMTSTVAPAFVPGVWGPYFSAMIPGLWLNEAGQSAAGAAIEHLVRFHPAAPEAEAAARAQGMDLVSFLCHRAAATRLSDSARLAEGLHVVPEFLGNRAPFADPAARALIAGLTMDRSVENLVALYVAGVCGLGYGLRQIIAAQGAQGITTTVIVISGGAGQSPLVRQLLADATGLPVAAPSTPEPVLLGSAILAAVAAGHHGSVPAGMAAMSSLGETHVPDTGALAAWHRGRFEAFELLQETGRRLRSL